MTAALTVPNQRLMSSATLTLVPLPPADQLFPPYSKALDTLSSSLQMPIATDDFTINGVLETSIASGAPGFVARAFQGTVQVSNAPVTQAYGSFQLILPSAVLTSGLDLAVQLTPRDSSEPWFVATPIMLGYPPFNPFSTPILLASYVGLNEFAFQLVDNSGQPVAGALVQAQTTLGTNQYGATQFSRQATSGTDGIVKLDLFPKLTYDFVVVPPATSGAATTCISPVSVSNGSQEGAANPPVSRYLNVGFRTTVSGHVWDATGAPVANVAITATPGPGTTIFCPATPAAPGSTTTDTTGSFSLALDQGTYQFDFDPPAGSAAPRLTETVDVLGAAPIDLPVALPKAELLEGTVLAADGLTPLPSATVRLYEPQCTGDACNVPNPPAPVLRGQAVTDSTGTFRFSVALPN
jgi:hypothetical protein